LFRESNLLGDGAWLSVNFSSFYPTLFPIGVWGVLLPALLLPLELVGR
jgi:hypothetical protein